MPPDQKMPPLPRDSEALSFSEMVPRRSHKIRIAKSGIIFPGMLTVVVAVYLFSVFNDFSAAAAQGFTMAVGSYIVLMLFWMVYAYSDTDKPLWIFALPLAFTAINVTAYSPIWRGIAFVSRDLLPGRPTPGDTFVMKFIHMFFAAGVAEELTKAVPILFCAWLALRAEKSGGTKPGSLADRLAVRTPLDGVMIGLASGAGFVINETFFEYVPNITAKVAESTNNPFAGLLFGLMLMIPRTLQSFAGHMGWAAIFGYFVGLGMVRRQNRLALFGIGFLSTAVIHGLWNSVGMITPLLSYGVAALGFLYFLACLLKARQMEPQLTGRQISAGASIVVMPTASAAVARIETAGPDTP